MIRSLRFQLIAIVTLTVALVLGGSQWLDTTLSERALEHDIKARAERALEIVRTRWGHVDVDDLRRILTTFVQGNSEFEAFDVFVLDDHDVRPEFTTRPSASLMGLAGAELSSVLAGGSVTTPGEGMDRWRITMPLRRDGVVTGAVRVDLSLAEAARLKARLRTIDALFLVLSVGAISLLLATFLERRVGRPVTALVGGMRRAESGVLGVRVDALGAAEFNFLASRFNRMLASIEDLTSGLEERVRQATKQLADKNTELQDANTKLWRAQLEIGRSERLAALGQMAATLAHELGTPLNSVLGYAQLLLREQPSPDQAAKLTILESQVQRMIETMRSVLDRTRELRREPVAVGPLVAEALMLVSSRLAGRALVVQSQVAPDLPTVPADSASLRQVLLNLLTNAIDATEASGTVTVSAGLAMGNGRPGRWLELTVSDTGHGMAPDEVRRVFEPFYTTKAPGRGTGLGLSIVDHIVRAHGGQLAVDSAPGRGTTMRVRLPVEA